MKRFSYNFEIKIPRKIESLKSKSDYFHSM